MRLAMFLRIDQDKEEPDWWEQIRAALKIHSPPGQSRAQMWPAAWWDSTTARSPTATPAVQFRTAVPGWAGSSAFCTQVPSRLLIQPAWFQAENQDTREAWRA